MKPPIKGFWGKVKRDKDKNIIKAWLPLVDHSIDVAITFRRLLNLSLILRRFETAAGRPLTQANLDRLAVLVMLHDMGKANLGFRGKIFPGAKVKAGHVSNKIIAPLLCESDLCEKFLSAIRFEIIKTWFSSQEALSGLLFAVLSHHGKPLDIRHVEKHGDYIRAANSWWRPGGDLDPMREIAELIEASNKVFPRAFGPVETTIPESPALQHYFAGLVVLADWLASHEGFFPYDNDNGKLDRAKFSFKAAPLAIKAIGLDIHEFRNELQNLNPGFDKIFGFRPYNVQKTIFDASSLLKNERLLILEDETGSGKTEAALARFYSLFSAGEVDSLYFALPTRVAARELYGRIVDYMEKAFPDPDKRPITLLAVPGYARVDNVDAKSIFPDTDSLWVDDYNIRARERSWAAERPKRFLAATVAVGTIDQALLSSLQTPHAHLRSVLLDRSLLVVDEVHASDLYMSYLLKKLLDHHLHVGSHAMLLSATLGATAKAAFVANPGEHGKPPDFETARSEQYPALTGLNGTINIPRFGKAMDNRNSKRVEIEFRDCLFKIEEMAPEILTALDNKARVLVVLNTVDRAIRLQKAVEAAAGENLAGLFELNDIKCPHHGRFAPADREKLDEAVTKRFGINSADGPALLIGTQTLEQSLDIDADLLITDLCPMDVLLQRIGRLHRHKRERPDNHKTPHCLLIVPPDESLDSYLTDKGEAVGTVKKEGLGSVYPDMRSLRLTIETLKEREALKIPEDNRRLVESATHSDRLSRFDDDSRWKSHGGKIAGIGMAQEVAAHYATLSELYEKSFGDFSFGELGEKARTRLGLDSRRLLFPGKVKSPFGVNVLDIVIPGRMVDRDAESETVKLLENETTSDVLIFEHGKHCYRYSRFGLEKENEPSD